MYEAEVLPEAQRHLNRLPPAVREAALLESTHCGFSLATGLLSDCCGWGL